MPKERVLIVPQGLRIEVPPIAEGKFGVRNFKYYKIYYNLYNFLKLYY